ncbi:putative reverse transcriptase zinc-binding domain-containing protein [Arabidopsis thaliana]
MDITLKVNQLFDRRKRNWNVNLLKNLFPDKDIQIILQHRPMMSCEDFHCWAHTKNGLYSVKSGYEFISRKVHSKMFQQAENTPTLNPLFAKVWNLQTAPKIKIFLWKVLNGAVAVEDRLRCRGVKADEGCLMCGADQETINHILFLCPLARQIWALSLVPSALYGFGSSIFTNLCHVFDMV